MDLIQEQVINMLPLFAFIVLGFVSGKTLKINDYSLLSKLLLFVFTPIIAFNAIVTVDLQIELLSLPIIFFTVSTLTAFGSKFILGKFLRWEDDLVNSFSYSAGSGNVAFYGIPAVLILFGEEFLPVILISMIGYIVYDSSIGYLIASGNQFKINDILKKLLKFPPFIAVLVGMVFMPFDINFSDINGYDYIVKNSQSTMATLGIFLVGLAVSRLKIKTNYQYLTLIALQKVVIWPLILLFILLIDKITIDALQEYINVVMLIATVPVATNSVILAAEYTKREDQAALGVMTTAILSLLSIPIWQYIADTVLL